MTALARLRLKAGTILKSPDLRKSFVYIGASFIGYGIVFLQNFSLAYFLSINFYGKVTLLISLFSTMYVIFTFGLNAVIQRFYFNKTFASDERSLVSHVFVLWLLLGGAAIALTVVSGISEILPVDYYREFLPVVFAAFFFSITEIFPNLFIVREQPIRFAAWLIGSRATVFVLLHAAVFFFGESSYHISLMLMLSGLFLTVIGFVTFRLIPISKLHRNYVKEILGYAFPLMIYALGGIGYSHGYRVIISNWLSLEGLGIFSLTSQIALVYYLTATSSITGLYPRAYRSLEESAGNPVSIRFYLKTLFLVGTGLLFVIGPLGYFFIQHFKGGSFSKGLEIFPVLMLGQFIFFLYGYNYILCTFFKKTKIITYSMLAGVATSLSLAYLLIRDSSLLGAAVPIVCGIIVQFAVSAILLNRIIKNSSINFAPK